MIPFIVESNVACCNPGGDDFRGHDTARFAQVVDYGARIGSRSTRALCEVECTSRPWCSAFVYGKRRRQSECWLHNNGCSNKCTDRNFDFHTKEATLQAYTSIEKNKRCVESSLISRWPGPAGKSLQECYQACVSHIACVYFGHWSEIGEASESGSNDCRTYSSGCEPYGDLMPGFNNTLYRLNDLEHTSASVIAGIQHVVHHVDVTTPPASCFISGDWSAGFAVGMALSGVVGLCAFSALKALDRRHTSQARAFIGSSSQPLSGYDAE